MERLTGSSIRNPIGITDAKSVKVLRRAFFSFSVSSSPVAALFSKAIAADTSMANSWLPCQTSYKDNQRKPRNIYSQQDPSNCYTCTREKERKCVCVYVKSIWDKMISCKLEIYHVSGLWKLSPYVRMQYNKKLNDPKQNAS